MFSKKYIFETRKTRTQRIISTSLIVLISLFLGFFLMTVYLPIYAKNQNKISEQVFFQRTPDVIAVFTGDIGRIAHTLKKAEKYPATKIFITGVYAKNSLKTLLEKQGRDISVDDYLVEESHHIELDYLARNTIENGLATIRFLQKHEAHTKVLIVSSDYHIFRISRIMNALKDENSKYEFYYESIPSDYTNMSSITKLVKEVYKFFKTSTFLMFWDKETGSIHID